MLGLDKQRLNKKIGMRRQHNNNDDDNNKWIIMRRTQPDIMTLNEAVLAACKTYDIMRQCHVKEMSLRYTLVLFCF